MDSRCRLPSLKVHIDKFSPHDQEQLGRVPVRREPVLSLLRHLPPLPLTLFTFTLSGENLKERKSKNNFPKKTLIHHINQGDLFSLLSQPSRLPVPSASLLPPSQVILTKPGGAQPTKLLLVSTQSQLQTHFFDFSRHSGHLSLPLYSHGVILRFQPFTSFKFFFFPP